MSNRFEGKIVVVAGGTGGLGRAVSLAFLGEGAHVVVTYRNKTEFSALQTEAAAKAQSLEGYALDVTNDADTAQFVKSLTDSGKKIGALVNAVGAYAGGTPLWRTEPEVFDQMLSLNLRSGYILARAIAPQMVKQGFGAIVNVASRSAFDHAAGAAAYAASKAAAVAMFDSFAADLTGSGVRSNSILPSIIDTEANRKAMPNADFSKWPKPDEIARVILFLCSDDAKLVHGASVPVYGANA